MNEKELLRELAEVPTVNESNEECLTDLILTL